MDNTNSQKCDFSLSGGDSILSSEKLCSSQPNVFPSVVNGEPMPQAASTVGERPIVPPRNYRLTPTTPMLQNPYNSYNRSPFPRLLGGGYSPYGHNSTYPYSYNSNMMGGYGLNGYNMNNPESRFARAAEESTRPTFQAIESVTRAINSVAFMMESTFGSLNMSFQAILSVIENFSHARKFLKQVITSIFTLRIFHKFLLVLVNLMRKMNILSDEAVARLPLLRTPIESASSGLSLWPVATFFGLVFGAPYIISKMLPTCEENSQSQAAWNPSTDRCIPLVGVHDFKGASEEELSFGQGQQLKMIPPEIMAPTSRYWVFVADDQNRTGFVPRNHVAPV